MSKTETKEDSSGNIVTTFFSESNSITKRTIEFKNDAPYPTSKKTFVELYNEKGELVEERIETTNSSLDVIMSAKYEGGALTSCSELRHYGLNKIFKTSRIVLPPRFEKEKKSLLRLPAVYGSEFPSENLHCTLTNFNADTDSRRRVLDVALDVLTNATKGRVLYVHGLPGCGKTHIQSALAKALVAQGKSVYFYGQGSADAPGHVESYPFCNHIFIDDLPLPSVGTYFEVVVDQDSNVPKAIPHTNLIRFFDWYIWAEKNQKTLWISSNQEYVDMLFDNQRIQTDIERLKLEHPRVDVSQLERLCGLRFENMIIMNMQGPSLRFGLADKLSSSSLKIEDIYSEPGSPPGLIVVNPKEYLQIMQRPFKAPTKLISMNEGIGMIQGERVLIFDDRINPMEQLAVFTRTAWERGILIILRSEKSKDQLKDSIIRAYETGHEMHRGKEAGNISRINSMLVSYSELSKVPSVIQVSSSGLFGKNALEPGMEGLDEPASKRYCI